MLLLVSFRSLPIGQLLGAKFRQQELWAWKPVWSPQVVVIMYLIVAVLFIPIGVAVLIQSQRMVRTDRRRYDNLPGCNVGVESNTTTFNVCTVPVDIDRDIEGRSYMYYGLANFYQNARNYEKSRSFEQLRGEEVTEAQLEDCDPAIRDDSGNFLTPCGLIANSQFNDSFILCRDENCNDRVFLNDTGIAWDIDREKRFRPSESNTEAQNDLIRSEDFMVWMRVSTYRDWKKLYRIIEEDLPAGRYYVQVNASFPVESFDGEKFFFIAETKWFGGSNTALGISYLVVGGVALIFAIGFFVQSRATPDMDLPPETTVVFGDKQDEGADNSNGHEPMHAGG